MHWKISALLAVVFFMSMFGCSNGEELLIGSY